MCGKRAILIKHLFQHEIIRRYNVEGETRGMSKRV